MPWDIWLIFFALAVVLPWRGRARMKKLLAMPQVGTMERLVLYASTMAFQWFAVAVVAWRAWIHRYAAAELGLTIHDRARILAAGIVGAATLAALQWLNLRHAGKLPLKARGRFQAMAERILPQSTVELFPYLALALTAGLCEEFLYRGFLMAVLTRTGFSIWAAVLVSSVLFGLAHLYQGRSGLVATLIVGVALGIARITYDSLVPVIFWHTALDAVAGVAGRQYLRGSSAPTEDGHRRTPAK
jgi:membrane protease YdiL (CAAX protease family)